MRFEGVFFGGGELDGEIGLLGMFRVDWFNFMISLSWR